jgi:hypothetical protein
MLREEEKKCVQVNIIWELEKIEDKFLLGVRDSQWQSIDLTQSVR